MRLPEQGQQAFVAHLGRVEDHEHDFRVPRKAAAHFLVGRVRSDAASVARSRAEDSFGFPEAALRTPEAAETEYRLLQAGWERALQRVAIHEVCGRNRHGRIAAGQRFVARGKGGLSAFAEHIRSPGSVRRG